ncbi:unnamed protein product [Acanthosepion pharaonis]|uniref:Integrase catalytic domain-containing protein n=1 Tax=Acanthosepion pharaonis TaxID=158019 RepID=A0A812ASC5_ACAPH|nr:unnamed protein product [Sepia pharaonis]
MPHEIPVRPWQIVATDIFNLNRHNYLLVVDYNSKYPFIRKLKEFSSKEVIDFTKRIFAEQGVPERLTSDSGPHFSSRHFKEFAKAWDFEHITSSPKYPPPRSNGMAERCIQTIKGAMKKAMLSNRDVDMSLLCLRLTPMDHVIPSPGKLLFNRKLVSNLPTKCTNNNARKEEIQDRLLDRQWLQGKQHDQHAKDLSKLSTGQLVRVQEQDTRKWTSAVVRQICTEPRSYIIETPTGQVLRRNRRHLKEDISNKALTSLHSTSLPPPANIPNTPPAGTPNTPSNICTPSKATLTNSSHPSTPLSRNTSQLKTSSAKKATPSTASAQIHFSHPSTPLSRDSIQQKPSPFKKAISSTSTDTYFPSFNSSQ